MGKDSEIIIEDFVGISGSSICAASRITIGKGTIIGTGSVIMDTDFHHPDGEYRWDNDATSRSQPINIGRGVFIGTRCIILKGVTIGDRAIIAAGSVVAKDVAANTVVGSNTMQVLRHAY
ncbi:MAG: acyltransferase [Verrucomicrobiae bacterium]|nr:acyltransferase [Verrucomicrobiae bacterium]NNJ42519.1 acyltransferase [Akkermansiaceae bacterium]